MRHAISIQNLSIPFLTVSILFFGYETSPLLALIFASSLLLFLFLQILKYHKEKTLLQAQLTQLKNQEFSYKQQMQKTHKALEDKYLLNSTTSLPNRNALQEKLQQGGSFTLILLNIDAFKEINEFYSPKVGDSLIKQLATVLPATPILFAHKLYHLHTDEFAFLLEGNILQEESLQIVKEIDRYLLKQTYYASMNQTILFTLSYGISFSKEDESSHEQLIVEATHALTYAKNHHKSYMIYNQIQHQPNQYEKNLYWLQKVKSAIDEDRILPYFQPIVNHKTGEIISYEALIRLIERNGAAISPYLFLDVAKKSKLYTTLTKIMIEKSFAIFANNNLHFSINFSYEDMIDEEILTLLTSKLKNKKIGKRFTAEILESESIGNYDLIKQFIDTIKSYGASVAIDDFGSGYSNFEPLFKLDIDMIKIDGSIIKDIDENQQLKIITETIVTFAQKTDIKVIAEFVHAKEIANILDDIGVEWMQGYYFAEPSETIISTLPTPTEISLS